MSVTSFDNDNDISYLFLDWGELGALSYALAGKILAHEKEPFDRIIALATGGHTMSKALKDYLSIKNISSMQISFYETIGQTNHTPVISQSIATNIQNERVLVFDDINDSGKTLEVATEYLKLRGVSQIVTATLLQKQVSKFKSDYYGEETSSWIIFPDEIRETIVNLTKRWQVQNLTEPIIHDRLIKIGFSDAHIELIKNNP